VSTIGTDTWTNATNPATPCSLSTALINAVAGDTVYLRAGTYVGDSYKPTNNGTIGNPITFKAYPGEIPILDGAYTTQAGRFPVWDLDGSQYITLDSLEIKRGCTANVYLGFNNGVNTIGITIQNCNIHDYVAKDNSGQIYINNLCDKTIITNNELHGCSGATGVPAGIMSFRAKDLTITHNYIHDHTGIGSGGTGIMLKFGENLGQTVLIEYNHIYNHDRFACLFNQNYVTFQNNLIHQSGGGKGLLIFDASTTCAWSPVDHNLILHNTFINCGVYLAGPGSSGCPATVNTTVQNNLMYNYSNTEYRGLGIWDYESTDTSATTMDYNLMYSALLSPPIRVLATTYAINSTPVSVTNGGHNVATAPTFVNEAGGDYTLTTGSAGHAAASDGNNMGVVNMALVGIQ